MCTAGMALLDALTEAGVSYIPPASSSIAIGSSLVI
jgi:hypothetical protein